MTSCIREGHGNLTIPRHLRDVYVSEYGVADLRGRTDEDCIAAMAAIADARFAPGLLARARQAGKVDPGATVDRAAERNTPRACTPRCDSSVATARCRSIRSAATSRRSSGGSSARSGGCDSTR